MALRATLRPVSIATYGVAVPESGPLTVVRPLAEVPSASSQQLRGNFPVAGENSFGGTSDGYRFEILFGAGRLESSYVMVRQFLIEQGYADVPVPADIDELKAFRLPPKLRHQLSLFGEDGYVHNPIKILFPSKGSKRGALRLHLHNEGMTDHLLQFHNRKRPV